MSAQHQENSAPRPADQDQIESVLRLINRELWIVTSAHANRRGGLVATWISEASIDPRHPVMAAGIAPNHFTAHLIDQSGAFALHLLRPDQAAVAWNFCRDSGENRDKLAGVDYRAEASGSPILGECLAWLDCRVFARVATGDRLYYWADVLAGQRLAEGQPLREREFFDSADSEQKRLLAERRWLDIELQQPGWSRWRADLPEGQRPVSREA